MADKAQYGNSERGKVFKSKATIEEAGLHVVGTKDVEHNQEGNVSTALARNATGEMKKRVVDTPCKSIARYIYVQQYHHNFRQTC